MGQNDQDTSIDELLKLGVVSSSEWQSYTWKNALEEQKSLIVQCLAEAIAQEETDHDPLHMLERAVGMAAVCMRRLIECHLVTDRFRDSKLRVHVVNVKTDVEWHEPFVRQTAGGIFSNYDMIARHLEQQKPKIIADRLLHARVVGVLSGSLYLPDGLLIASDSQRKTQLFHFTENEIVDIFDAFSKDEVTCERDEYIYADGNVSRPRTLLTIRE